MEIVKKMLMKRRKFIKDIAVGSTLSMLPLSWVLGKDKQDIAAPQPAQGPVYNIENFGAKGDGTTLNTESIQKAINTCHANGGGTVYFPAGRYLSGTIVFKSNVTLSLGAGAVLLGSTKLRHFPEKTPEFRSYTDVNYTNKSLIYAEKVTNIAITGRGVIDGQGEEEPYQLGGDPKNYKKRPFMIRMIECENVLVRDITLTHSPMWVQHYLACENVNIDGITIHSNANVNNDGIDIDCCNKVRISDCEINSGDDAIVLKATAPKDCENITITNCILRSHTNAFKCGTESTGGFKNITVSNCTIYNVRNAGIALEMVDGGTMDRVMISNITMVNAKGGIFIRLGDRARPYLAEGSGRPNEKQYIREKGMDIPDVGSLQNVILSNIIATGLDDVGCSITGVPEQSAENITLENIRLTFQGGGSKELIHRDVPEEVDSYPARRMFGKLPAYGFYCRHVNNLRFHGVQLDYKTAEARPAFVFDDINGLYLTDIQAEKPTSNNPSFLFEDVKNLKKEN